MKNITVGEFIVESQNNFPGSTGELSKILSAIKLALNAQFRVKINRN